MCALDESGNVCHDEGALRVELNYTEDRFGRRERVVGNPGPGGANPSQKTRLAGVGKTDEADIGE